MKWNNILITAYLLFVFCYFTVGVFAQTKEDKQALLGKWELKEIAVSDPNSLSAVNMDSMDIDIYSEIEIRERIIRLVNKETFVEGEYTIENNYLAFVSDSQKGIVDKQKSLHSDPFSVSFLVEWKVKDDTILYLRQNKRDSTDNSKIFLISLIYKRK